MTEAISSSPFSVSLCQINKEVHCLVEGAFAHYFSTDKSVYHHDDIQWFLEFANKHEKWSTNSCNIKAGTGLLSCDSAKATLQHHYQKGFSTVS